LVRGQGIGGLYLHTRFNELAGEGAALILDLSEGKQEFPALPVKPKNLLPDLQTQYSGQILTFLAFQLQQRLPVERTGKN
jgi:hypothetical protein